MSIKLESFDGRSDFETDGCCNEPIAVLSVNNIIIPLCSNCIEELTEKLMEFNNTIFCHKCDHFIMSEYGWRYGGSCKLQATKDGVSITNKDAGLKYVKYCMDTCPDAILRKI